MTGNISPLAPKSMDELHNVPGVRLASIAAGLRYRDRPDLTLIVAEAGSVIVGVQTQSTLAGHPVLWNREQLPGGKARAVLINAGNANVCNGAKGDQAVRDSVAMVCQHVDCQPENVLIASTGVIGEPLDVAPIEASLPTLKSALSEAGWKDAALGIMTTDTFPKYASRQVIIDGHAVTITGIAKGSGMIAPNMATMLAYMATDARLSTDVANALIQECNQRSFNAVSVDGDTSTSDMALLVVSRKSAMSEITDTSDPRYHAFRDVLQAVMTDLAQMVARDGEGATKFITVRVVGAQHDSDAHVFAMSVANSPLVKTAIAGEDANWGRVVMALGKCGAPLDPDALAISFGEFPVAINGGSVPGYDEAPVAAYMKQPEIDVAIVVGDGAGSAEVWSCDLTHSYIDINADYRS